MSRFSLFREFLLAPVCSIILIGADHVAAAQLGVTPAGAAQLGTAQTGTSQAGAVQSGTGPTGAAPAPAGNIPPPPPPPVFNGWTGFYAGAQIGYAWGDNIGTAVYATPGGLFGDYSLGGDAQGVIGGAHAGYNYQIDQWVLGLEGAVDPTTLSRNMLVLPVDGSTIAGNIRSDIQGSIRARAGFAFDRLLIYGTGGVAFAGFSSNLQLYGNDVLGPFYANGSHSSSRTGWTVGGGVEYGINSNYSVFGEYRYSDFGHITDLTVPGVVGTFETDNRHLSQNQVQVGFSYKFAPAPIVAKY